MPGRTLQHLNLTLQDIFDNHTDSFAVISVLTVGDLLQLNTAVFKTLQFGYEALADYLYGRTSSTEAFLMRASCMVNAFLLLF
jgi:hypothetical protein